MVEKGRKLVETAWRRRQTHRKVAGTGNTRHCRIFSSTSYSSGCVSYSPIDTAIVLPFSREPAFKLYTRPDPFLELGLSNES